MSNRLLLKSFGTADAVPDFGDLEIAELVINTRNGKMFCKTYDGQTYAIVDLTLSSPDEIIASGPGLIGRSASGAGPAELLSGADAVALLPAATASADGKATAGQIAALTELYNNRCLSAVTSSDFSPTADTTYQDIPDLSISGLVASATYCIEIMITGYQYANADIKFLIAPSDAAQMVNAIAQIGRLSIDTMVFITTSNLEITADFGSNNNYYVKITGVIKVSSNGGSIKLRAAERVNSTAPTVNAGSSMVLYRIG